MNIASCTFNSPREMALRVLYLIPMPLFLVACFLPLAACVYSQWHWIGLSGVLVAAAIYVRHLGVKYWEFERLDDVMDGITHQRSYEFATSPRTVTDQELDSMLLEIGKWDGQWANRPEGLLAAGARHRQGSGSQNYWDN